MILLVDDNHDLRTVLARLLKLDGYESVGVENATKALAFLQITRPSLIITDINMPGVDGLTLVAHIRKDTRLSDIPIIVFSAVEGQDSDTKAIAAGADVFIAKASMDWAVLQREIIRLIGPSNGSSQVPRVNPQRSHDAG